MPQIVPSVNTRCSHRAISLPSFLGVRRSREISVDLIYVAADGQTVITLAKILQHVGAVRAMEFDINPEWHTLITYTPGVPGWPVPLNRRAERGLVDDVSFGWRRDRLLAGMKTATSGLLARLAGPPRPPWAPHGPSCFRPPPAPPAPRLPARPAFGRARAGSPGLMTALVPGNGLRP
jgi:hypothetical protein